MNDLREVIFLLNTERRRGDIDVIRRDLIDGIVFAAFLESRAHTVRLAQIRELPRGRNAADRGDPASREIDQPVR